MSENDPNMVLQDLEKAKQSYSSGNYAAAEPLLREIFEKLEADPIEMAFVSECLSEIYTAWGKFSEAIKLNQRLINLTATNPGQSLEALGSALERIAAVSLKVGKKEQSDKLNRLAGAVRAGKIDVKTLVTEKAKVPLAPPTTEHTYTFRALGPDSPPPSEMTSSSGTSIPAVNPPTAEVKEAADARAAASPSMPATEQTPSSEHVPALPPGLAIPATSFTSFAPPEPPAAPGSAAPPPDVLTRPTKETAMFSRPSLPPAPVPPAVPPKTVPASAVKQDEIPDYQLADFDEEIAIAAPAGTPQAAEIPTAQQEPSADLWGPMEPPAAEISVSSASAAIPAEEFEFAEPQTFESPQAADAWGPPSDESADIHDEWGPAEPSAELPADTWGAPDVPVQAPTKQWQHPATISQTAAAIKLQAAQQAAAQEQAQAQEAEVNSSVASHSDTGSGESADQASSPHVEQEHFNPSDLQGVISQSLSSQSLPAQSISSQSNTASSVRSMRSMSSRSMAAPPRAGAPDMGGLMGMIAQFFVGKRDPDQPVQELVDPSTTSAKAAGALVLIVGVVVGLTYAAYHMPRKLSPADAYRAIQHKYVSTDSTKSLILTDPASCEFAVGEKKMPAKLRFYLDDWRDAMDMSLGRVGEKQIWMVGTGDGIVDEDQIKLYVNGGPELQLANRIDFVNQYATMQFQKEKKYPERANLNPAIDLHYLNPYTKKKELPSFFKVAVGKDLASHEADQARTRFYDALLSGQVAPDTPKAHAGEIRCYAVDFLSPRGTIEGFIVQLIGKDAKPLSGVRPRSSYLFALEDGKEYKPAEAAELPFKGEPGLRPAVVWLLMDKLDQTFVFILMSAPVIIFTILTFFFLILSFVIPRGLGRAVSVVLLVLCAIPALLFCLVKVLP